MLNEYFELGNRIRKHYVSPGVILCLVTGRFVPPIHRKNLYSLQYSMLPAQRVGIQELWRLLTEMDKVQPEEWNKGTGNGFVNGGVYLRRGVGRGGGERGGGG
jgi:phosphatidylinositol N-acetylglucosaminyltransferase subunit Q